MPADLRLDYEPSSAPLTFTLPLAVLTSPVVAGLVWIGFKIFG